VTLFHRRQPLHRRLAELGGLGDAFAADPERGRDPRAAVAAPAAAPPGWHGEPRGEPGIHGVPRARRWEAVLAVAAPSLRGDVVHFVALPDGTLLVDEEEPDEALEPVADAVEQRLAPPYRAEAVRRDGDRWAVGASRIAVAELPGLDGDEAELVTTRAGSELRVDGRPRFGSLPALERLGQVQGTEFVVRARRLDGDAWEVETTPL
jgi:hypothetical protein